MKRLGHAARFGRQRGPTGSGRWLAIHVLLSACQTSTLANQGKGADALPTRDTQVTHGSCDMQTSTAKLLDVNGDGRADVIEVGEEAGRCFAYDLNLDGGVDSWVYQDGAGRLVRRELDFDRDGVPDEIALYSAGAPIERQLSTTVQGRLDTWHFYRAGKLIRTERDANGDGVIDQWWTYPKPECPVIVSDTNADGKPNPDSTIDLCKGGELPPSGRGRQGPRTFERPGAAPSEVESNTEQGSAEATPEPAKAKPGSSGDAEPGSPMKAGPLPAKDGEKEARPKGNPGTHSVADGESGDHAEGAPSEAKPAAPTPSPSKVRTRGEP